MSNELDDIDFLGYPIPTKYKIMMVALPVLFIVAAITEAITF
jgi:hypothetical protein